MPEPLPYLLPDLGEGMTEAELVQWRVAVGDHVTRDQIVVHVQTDKAEVELPVPASGTIVRLGADVGDLVPVGAPLLELIPDEGTALGGTPVRVGPSVTETVLVVSVFAPILVHPAPHLFLGLGPEAYNDISHAVGNSTNNRTFVGISSTVGGWF